MAIKPLSPELWTKIVRSGDFEARDLENIGQMNRTLHHATEGVGARSPWRKVCNQSYGAKVTRNVATHPLVTPPPGQSPPAFDYRQAYYAMARPSGDIAAWFTGPAGQSHEKARLWLESLRIRSPEAYDVHRHGLASIQGSDPFRQ